jgi:FkbM family methyltransferase
MTRMIALATLRTLGAVYPFQRSARLVDNQLTKWATASLNESVPVRTRNGITIHVIPSDAIGRQIYLTRTWDPHMLDVLQALAVGARTIVDVGANVGFFALSLAASSDAVVHAVEPQPRLADLIEKSARASNLLDHIQLHRFALSDHDGEADFIIDEGNLGGSRIASDNDSLTAIQVPLRNGSDFLDSLGVSSIDLMKVDVEGHEAQIFRSIETWIAKQRIRAIVFETRGHGEDDTAMQLVGQHGYQLFGISKGLRSPIISEISSQNARRFEDVVAVRLSDMPEVRQILGAWLR